MNAPDNWAELLTPGLRAIFNIQLKEGKDYIKELYSIEPSTKAEEINLGIGEIGEMVEWTGRTEFEDFNKGFEARYRHKKYNKGMEIQREMVDDDQYSAIKTRTSKLARSARNTRNSHAVSLFNNAFNNAMPGPDGVALCSTQHPVSPESTTYRINAFDYELDADNLERLRTFMLTQWFDDKSNQIVVDPDAFMLLVPSALRKKALVIADSDKEPDVTENNVNIWKGSVEVMEWNRLIDPKAWFLIEKSRMKEYLKWFDRRPVDFSNNIDWDTEIAQYRVIGRWSWGFDDHTWIIGCKSPV